MKLATRLHPFDVALAATASVAVVYLVVVMTGYRWAGDIRSGYLKTAPAELAIEVRDPVVVRLARELEPGDLRVQSAGDWVRVAVRGVDGASDGVVVMRVGVVASLDRDGRATWGAYGLRLGAEIALMTRDRELRGTIVAITGLDAARGAEP